MKLDDGNARYLSVYHIFFLILVLLAHMGEGGEAKWIMMGARVTFHSRAYIFTSISYSKMDKHNKEKRKNFEKKRKKSKQLKKQKSE